MVPTQYQIQFRENPSLPLDHGREEPTSTVIVVAVYRRHQRADKATVALVARYYRYNEGQGDSLWVSTTSH